MREFINKLNGYALYFLSRMLWFTCRFQIQGWERIKSAVEDEKPFVVCGWHGMTMMLVPFCGHYVDLKSFVAIMPDDWRGMSISVFVKKWRVTSFPMKLKGDDTMGMARRFVELVREVQNGKNCYFTPDGPEGPGYVVKPGATYISRKTQVPILPIGAYARNAYRVNRWDQYAIPFPFSRVSIFVGEPFIVSKDEKDLEVANQDLTDKLHRAAAQAAANYYERKSKDDMIMLFRNSNLGD